MVGHLVTEDDERALLGEQPAAANPVSAVAFTPGPWSAIFDDSDWYVTAYVNRHPTIIADIEPMVSSKAIEANARLIAAAPELYEALERVWDAYGFDPSIDSSIWQEVQAALAKARGEQP